MEIFEFSFSPFELLDFKRFAQLEQLLPLIEEAFVVIEKDRTLGDLEKCVEDANFFIKWLYEKEKVNFLGPTRRLDDHPNLTPVYFDTLVWELSRVDKDWMDSPITNSSEMLAVVAAAELTRAVSLLTSGVAPMSSDEKAEAIERLQKQYPNRIIESEPQNKLATFDQLDEETKASNTAAAYHFVTNASLAIIQSVKIRAGIEAELKVSATAKRNVLTRHSRDAHVRKDEIIRLFRSGIWQSQSDFRKNNIDLYLAFCEKKKLGQSTDNADDYMRKTLSKHLKEYPDEKEKHLKK